MTHSERAAFPKRVQRRLNNEWDTHLTGVDHRLLTPKEANNYAENINKEIEYAVTLAKQGKLYESIKHLRSLNQTVLWGSGFFIDKPRGRQIVVSANLDKTKIEDIRYWLAHSSVNAEGTGVAYIRIDELKIVDADGKPLPLNEQEKLPNVQAARWLELAITIEELTHVVQFLQKQAGKPFYVSRLMSSPTNAATILNEANKSGPGASDPEAVEADAYARIIELFGLNQLPKGLEKHYSSRPVVLKLMSQSHRRIPKEFDR
jgi:hypothetical protein